jgi:hypothetical protein
MLGFVSRFGSSKGMVSVPNLLGVATATANTQVTSAGLRVSSLSGPRNTNVISEGGVSVAQTPAAGTLVDYETEIVITSGNYIADTVIVGPCENYGTTVNDADYCSGTLYVYGSARTKRRKTVTTTNNATGTTTTSFDNSCNDDVVPRGSAYINGQCGYVTPPVASCTADNYFVVVPWSACSGGSRTRTVGSRDIYCNETRTTETEKCCVAGLVSCTTWANVPGGQSRTCTYKRADCSTYTEVEIKCVVSTRTTCTTCTKKAPFRKTCTTTTISSDCSQSSSSASQAC